MTDAPKFGAGSRLTFNSPLSAERADRIVRDLSARRPATVTDFGCGWGELLLRVVAGTPGARGVGIDTHGPDLDRGRAAATVRGLADRVTFIDGPAADNADRADVVINIGAYQAFGDVAGALRALFDRVSPGGCLLAGVEYWDRPPTEEQLAQMWDGISADDCTDLATLVDKATAAGFRPLRIESVSRGEWEEFESGYTAEQEEWLLANAGHPDADTVRAKVDEARSIWLRGHRDVMGFAYLTLGAPTA
jgi:SAM-dependent methyltransferase